MLQVVELQQKIRVVNAALEVSSPAQLAKALIPDDDTNDAQHKRKQLADSLANWCSAEPPRNPRTLEFFKLVALAAMKRMSGSVVSAPHLACCAVSEFVDLMDDKLKARVRLTGQHYELPSELIGARTARNGADWYDFATVEALTELSRAPVAQMPASERRDKLHQLESKLIGTRPPRKGDNILGVELVSLVGSGSFGEVWDGIYASTGEKRAVKIFANNKFKMHLAMRQFREGVAVLERLNRMSSRPATIVRMHDRDKSGLAFSMDFFKDGDLGNESPNQRGWAFDTRVEVFRKLCGALKFAHDVEVIHRDIKPGNILVGPNCTPVLTDFDIAVNSAEAAHLVTYVTPRYSSPQLLGGHQPSKTDDIYGLGCVLLFLLRSETPPFPIDAEVIRGLSGTYPRYLVEIISRCTAMDPVRRYKSVDQILEALQRGAMGRTPEVCAPRLSERIREAESGVFWWKTPAGFEIEMVYVEAGWFFMGNAYGERSEGPAHMRTIEQGYFIARYPITNGEFDRYCVSAGLARRDRFNAGERPQHPAVVTWDEAVDFCQWAGLSLPTEPQWEKAARGPDGATYPWGEAEPAANLCNWNGHPEYRGKSSTPVDAFPDGESRYGVRDSVGNIWQWCAERWTEDAYLRFERGEESSDRDGDGLLRVCRGSSWVHGVDKLRCSYRLGLNHSYQDAPDTGVRPVYSVTTAALLK